MLRNSIKTSILVFSFVIAKLCFLKQKPSILMYHSFDTVGWKYGVHPIELEKQIKHLLQHYKIVPMTDIVDHVSEKTILPNNAVAITIDDGYADTYEVFFDIAKKYDIPFTVFLTTDLSKRPNLGNLPRPSVAMLKDMQESGLVEYGLHGHTHEHFNLVFSENKVDEEIHHSENWLKNKLGILPRFVAYPSGKYTEAALTYFRKTDRYLAGLSIRSGFVTLRDDLFLLPRIEVDRNIPNQLSFRLRLTPALTVYNQIISRIKI